MPTVAYLANQFPSPVEPYVVDEIQELRRRKVTVIPCSAGQAGTNLDPGLNAFAFETRYLQPLRLQLLIYATLLCIVKFRLLHEVLRRVLFQGSEPVSQRLRTLLHTWLGVYYAILIEKSQPDHIHVHHGYFASWIAMVAARFLGIEFSMTLHGSDLLVHPAYLDLKLKHCQFCVTISEFNRSYILDHYTEIRSDKIIVQRMGVEPRNDDRCSAQRPRTGDLVILAVGRLHPVKDHAFLVRACRLLRDRGVNVACRIAGDGPERGSIEALIRELDLQAHIWLLGHLSPGQLDSQYDAADLVVLTSRSEGIPLVMMEAMVRGKTVLAPAITGIPELIRDGQNGFHYRQGSLDDFVARVELIRRSDSTLSSLRRAARQHVLQHFNRRTNLDAFCNLLLTHIRPASTNRTLERHSYENPLLQ